MMTIPEILAPCGNMAAFHAALSSGADAMYLALKEFGARAYASNFELDELLSVIEEAHLHNRRIYLTLNTLLRPGEPERIPEVMDPLYLAGLDAVLIQDFGLYRLLRERYPDLPLHASTQMNLCSVEGAVYAKSLGFSRVVPARELSLEELSGIRQKAGIEVEAFVHGAMCYCYSGRCYLSSFQGGRSGNRGRCAQPCRKKVNGRYLFSMKDLCTLRDIPRLMEAGIDSLKIEGRMKNEYYVAACVDAYRTLVEDVRLGVFREEKAVKLEERLAEVFNRGGFTGGYLHQVSGEDMLDYTMPGRAGIPLGTIRKTEEGKIHFRTEKALNRGDSLEIRSIAEGNPVRLTVPKDVPAGSEAVLAAPETRRLGRGTMVYRVRNAAITAELDSRFLGTSPKIPLSLSLTLSAGEPVVLAGTTEDGISCIEEGNPAETAAGRPVTDEVIRSKIGTLGNTPFLLTELSLRNDGKSFIPAGELKRLRRSLIERLLREMTDRFRRSEETIRKDRFPGEEIMEEGFTGKGLKKDSFPGEEITKKDFPETEGQRGDFPGTESGGALLPSGTVCQVTSIRQARFLLLLPEKPAVIIFRNDLSWMDPGEISRFAEGKKGVQFLIALPAITRSLIPEERLLSLYRVSLLLDGIYVPGIDSYAWLKLKCREEGGHPKILMLGEALYCYHPLAAAHFREDAEGMGDVLWTEAPYELFPEEAPGSTVRLIYGRIPLMRTVQDPGDISLGGEGNFPMLLYRNPELWYNSILSGRPVLADCGDAKPSFLFTSETEEQIEALMKNRKESSRQMPGKETGIRHRGLI